MSNDPTSLFFPDSDGSVDLYSVLNVSSTASGDEIKSAYRKLALKYHPDKHASASEEAKAAASTTFQQIGFAYAVLSDAKRRKRYDATGSADPGIDDLADGEDAWERYFQEMFDTVTRKQLDEMRQAYQGSDEERSDLRDAYLAGKGSIEHIMDAIPHSTFEDESRLVALVNDMIDAGELQRLPSWTSAIKDRKAQNARRKKGEKEAKEAEEAARELGVWDEFYGSGKAGKRRGKGKGTATSKDDPEGEDHSALKALIQSKAKKMDSFLDSLAEKYASASGPASKRGTAGRGRKRAAPAQEPEEEKKKKKKKRDQLSVVVKPKKA
ncbi:DnaJ domain protein [Ceratobasidium sp. AG-Ba]|nr:DnaJ domain protein [Ceratobasidium sp. AG-Ba]